MTKTTPETILAGAVVPAIHASDHSMAAGKEFIYFLRRRLGLVPALEYSEALSRGSWFHSAAQTIFMDLTDRQTFLSLLYDKRAGEVRDICKEAKYTDDVRQLIMDREYVDKVVANAWAEAACTLPLPPDNKMTLVEYVNQPHLSIVATELTLRLTQLDSLFDKPRLTPSVITIDALLYDERENALWILDLKTVGMRRVRNSDDHGAVHDRLICCKYEFGTMHYMHVTQAFLRESTLLQDHFGLPRDVKLHGMLHVGIGKPPLTYGSKDRAYRWVAEGKKSGLSGQCVPRGTAWVVTVSDGTQEELRDEDSAKDLLWGLVGKKPTRKTEGDPDPDLHKERCLDWYHARGDYAGDAFERRWAPVIGISRSDAGLFQTSDWTHHYERAAGYVEAVATTTPHPRAFDRVGIGQMQGYGNKLSVYADFILSPISHWPEIIRKKRFIVRHRDPVPVPMTQALIPYGSNKEVSATEVEVEVEVEAAEVAEVEGT